VSDIPETELSEARDPAQKSWWNSSSQQWASFLRNREEQVFLVLTLLIGAIPPVEQHGADCWCLWRARSEWAICSIAFSLTPGGAGFRKRKPPCTRAGGESHFAQSSESSFVLPHRLPVESRLGGKAQRFKLALELPPCWGASWDCAPRK
jgi:hypothetical protein